MEQFKNLDFFENKRSKESSGTYIQPKKMIESATVI